MWFRKKEIVREPFLTLKEHIETKPQYWTLNCAGDGLTCCHDIAIWSSYDEQINTFRKIHGIVTGAGTIECNRAEAKFIIPVLRKLLKDKQEDRYKRLIEKTERNRVKVTKTLQNDLVSR